MYSGADWLKHTARAHFRSTISTLPSRLTSDWSRTDTKPHSLPPPMEPSTYYQSISKACLLIKLERRSPLSLSQIHAARAHPPSHTHVFTLIRTHTYTHARTHARTHTHTHARTHTHIHTHTRTHRRTCTHALTGTHARADRHARTHALARA